MNWGPVPFKVFNVWLQNKDLKLSLDGLLEKKMEDNNVNIQTLLKLARGEIKHWSRQEKSSIDIKIKEVEKCINDIDNGLGRVADLPSSRAALDELYEQKVSLLRQKARLNWSVKGDRNTRFYH